MTLGEARKRLALIAALVDDGDEDTARDAEGIFWADVLKAIASGDGDGDEDPAELATIALETDDLDWEDD